MDRFRYVNKSVAQTLQQDFPQGTATDTVVVSIYNVDSATLDVNQVAMTSEHDGLFSYAWTPGSVTNYRIDYFNQTLQVHYYEYISCIVFSSSSSSTVPTAAVGTQFSVLKETFRKLIDNYNADDTGTNSSDEVAGICINKGLQLIYSLLKSSHYLQAYGSTALSSVANQAYMDLGGISDLDEIVSIKDVTNSISLMGISPDRYFKIVSNPANLTGTSFNYCRIFNRIYFVQRPTAVINYTIEYIKTYPDLSSASDAPLILPKFDDWIYKEARVQWYMMEDVNNVPQVVLLERADAREIYMADALSNSERNPQQAESNFGRPNAPRYNYYDHI